MGLNAFVLQKVKTEGVKDTYDGGDFKAMVIAMGTMLTPPNDCEADATAVEKDWTILITDKEFGSGAEIDSTKKEIKISTSKGVAEMAEGFFFELGNAAAAKE